MIERAAILADGADFSAVMDWISAHDGEPETAGRRSEPRPSRGAPRPQRGLDLSTPLRFVLPAGTLG